ncbi:MAG: 1-acyl-sn-glycerol-3-phosphate acyltransferase [Pseudomonadales bacterium]|nr:1-acyl-sn-glycerol-3-phosphate acyltransferase [Pseudomonadales bacterium]
MFSSTVSIPTWFFLLLLAATVYALVMSILFPGFRWYVSRRLNKAVDKINTGLQIKIRPLQQTKRQVLIDQLMFDQDILAMIESLSKEESIPREVLQQRVRSYAREIVPSFNAYVYFRVFYWLAKKVARFMYRVRVAAADPKSLREIDPESTVVFVMNHRSNMDYVLISYLVAERVALSYAAGEWARIFPLEMLIRAMGAFFVRRGSQNPLYRKVLERYVYMATQSGVCQAVFLEGGLSRDGKLAEPRLGFLDYILRNYDWQTDRNIVFLPASINYDQVLEDQNLLNWDDKSSRPGLIENVRRFWRFLRLNLFAGSRARWRRYGYASVNFGIPVSMVDYCSERELEFNHLDKETRFTRVKTLADELMDALRYVMPVLPVPVIAAVMLSSDDEVLTSLEIFSRCDKFIDDLIEGGAPMKTEEKPRQATLANSLNILTKRKLLTEEDDHYRVNQDHRKLLAYYANSIDHWWQNPAALASTTES